MSLFDVIKYPISEVPTPEQFEALPDKLFDEWTRDYGWPVTIFNRNKLAVAMGRVVTGESLPSNDLSIRVIESLVDLRKRIREYESI